MSDKVGHMKVTNLTEHEDGGATVEFDMDDTTAALAQELGSLDAFSDMCRLRLPSDTQQETRVVAQQISEKMSELFPVSWAALMGLEGEAQ